MLREMEIEMAESAIPEGDQIAPEESGFPGPGSSGDTAELQDIRYMLWGASISETVFARWSQGEICSTIHRPFLMHFPSSRLRVQPSRTHWPGAEPRRTLCRYRPCAGLPASISSGGFGLGGRLQLV